jgi:hypothetical protein
MADLPRLTTTRCQMGRSDEAGGEQLRNNLGELKTWPATPVDESFAIILDVQHLTLSELLP